MHTLIESQNNFYYIFDYFWSSTYFIQNFSYTMQDVYPLVECASLKVSGWPAHLQIRMVGRWQKLRWFALQSTPICPFDGSLAPKIRCNLNWNHLDNWPSVCIHYNKLILIGRAAFGTKRENVGSFIFSCWFVVPSLRGDYVCHSPTIMHFFSLIK